MQYREQIKEELLQTGCPFLEEEPLSAHTSFKIGGPAPLFLQPDSVPKLKSALSVLQKYQTPYFLLGNGSNVLAADEGIDCPVINLAGDFLAIRQEGENLIAGAGALYIAVCRRAMEAGLDGLQFAYGIPGSVGGAVYMNAGAYGGETADALLQVTFLDENGDFRTEKKENLALSYRHSLFCEKNWIITEAVFRLRAGDRSEIKRQMEDILARRKAKQPLEYPSAGSTFKRPEGHFAGALIEQAGLKGVSVGGAQVSEKHAGFVINRGGATAKDVRALIERIQKQVLETSGVRLEPEIRFFP